MNLLPTQQKEVVTASCRHLSVHPNDVAVTPQMKYPITSQWYIAKMSLWYVFTTSWSRKKRPKKVPRVSNNDIPLVCLHDLSNYSKTNHATTSWSYVAKTLNWNLKGTWTWRPMSASLQANPKWNNQWRLGGTPPPNLSITLLRRPVSMSLRRCQIILSWSPTGRLHLNLTSNNLY